MYRRFTRFLSSGSHFMKLLTQSFYNRPTLTVAKQLLGKTLCRRIGKKILRTTITEVEAYVGPHDKASHASRGKTKRNAIMFGPPGIAYIYLIYGMYWCLNIVTEREGYPAAVLIRAVEPITPSHSPLHKGEKEGVTKTNGPGKLCRALAITGDLNGADVTKGRELWIEDNAPYPPLNIRGGSGGVMRIKATPRIGVDYAGAWKHKKWRFLLTPR